MSKHKIDFKALLAKVKEQQAPTSLGSLVEEEEAIKLAAYKATLPVKPTATAVKEAIAEKLGTEVTGMHGETITYNTQQQKFIDLASSGESCVLIGAAGTGKTTCSQGAMSALLAGSKIPVLKADGHKHLVEGTPGIVICSYTRRAVNNIRKVQSEELKNNCITVHKLLEYALRTIKARR